MPFGHPLQVCRYELKYLIDEVTARQIRAYVQNYLIADEYASKTDFAYDVYSLYVDGPELDLCRATMHGLKNRFKLRIRFYDDDPDHPCFFELKRRETDAIIKTRAPVHKASVTALLAGRIPSPSDVQGGEGDTYNALRRFLEFKTALRADGKLFVAYRREAWVQDGDDDLRVTFDRVIRSHRYDARLGMRVGPVLHLRQGPVVLELKFNNRYPRWMEDLCRRFDLTRWFMAKYVEVANPALIPQPYTQPYFREIR